VQRRIRERNQGAQPIVAARELDHDQDVLVSHSFFLGRVDGAGECVGHGCVSRRKPGSTGAEDQAGFEEVSALELIDADFSGHVSCTYLS